MNKDSYRLVFSHLGNMLVAVAETATATGKEAGQTPVCSHGNPAGYTALFSLRQIAFAALALLGVLPAWSSAQIVPSGANAPNVISTANGLPQVNINRPSGAGVSMNTYSQFDVQKAGAILNNSPVITNTQQAGQINGNPNFGANQAARIIVNQVNSSAASQINGHLEVAGQRAEVVIANGSGISVNGGGFLNTSRAILTTGRPNFAPDGSLTGFNVRGGNITVQGAGLDGSTVDQVDLLVRAVQVNAEIYAGKNLNVITGANQIGHDSLAFTPIAGDGPAPDVSIDVSQLGGMYSGRIFLASNEYGVGVSNQGVIAAQAGDLRLQSNGLLSLAGKTSASGNLAATGSDIQNSGTTYAQQNATLSASGTVTNSGLVAAQQNTSLSGGSVSSTGTLAAGVNGDGSLAQTGDLNVSASGAVTATGRNVAGGNASVSGAALNLAGSTNSANGALVLAANGGDLNLSGATTTAGGALDVRAAGTLTNDNGAMSSGGAQTITAGALSNHYGQIVSGGTLTEAVAGAIDNQGGTMQAAGALSSSSGSLDNSGGTIASLNADGVSITTTGLLNNGANGAIGGNGNVGIQSGQIANAGSITAVQSLIASAVQTLFNSGTFATNANMTLSAGTTLANAGQFGSARALTLLAATFDNSGGTTSTDQFTLHATNLVNHGGTITQTGTGATTLDVTGTLDNSAGGTLQTNSTDLTLAPATLDNDGGTITHAGTGTLTTAPGNGAGSISNVDGTIITAGQIAAQAGSLNNATGVFAARGNIAASVAGNINNTQGAMRSLTSLSLASGGALTNTNGQIQSGTGAAGDASTLDVQAASIDNTGGLISNLGTGDTTVQGGSQLINSGGVMTGNGNVAVDTSALVNAQGGQLSGASLAVQADTLDNSDGRIGAFSGSTGDVAITTTGAIANANGQIGATHDLAVNAATLTGGGVYSAAHDVAVSVQGDFAPTPDVQFNAGHDLSFTLPGTFSNRALVEAANNLNVNAADVRNSGVMMAGGTLATHSDTLENTGVMVGGSVSLNATQSITNVGPTALIGATDSNGTLELLAPDIENRDDTTTTDTQASTAIYGLGKVVLAGGKNADGSYSSANLINNVSALIQSSGDMGLYATQVTNTRRVMTTDGAYVEPLDESSPFVEALGISLSGCAAIDMVACGPGNPQVQGLQFDPNASNYDPDAIARAQAQPGGMPIIPPNGGQWNSTYQYTTYTGVALANLITGISPQAQIIAGGNLDASNVGLFQNYWSAVAAVGNIAAPVTLDQNSWRGQLAPGVQVTYSGQYHYNNYDNTEHNWQLPFGDPNPGGSPFVTSNPGNYQVAPADVRTYALPSYESTFVAGSTLSGTGVNIDNTAGNAGIPSPGLAPGQSQGGVTVGGVSGGGLVNPVIASATAQNVLQNLSIPQGGLFSPASAPGATYLIETNPAFTNQKSFISSDYYLQQLGLNPQTVEKRLGDGFYEQQLVRNQITSLTGKAVLGPYTDLQSMYQAMLDAGASLAQSLDLPLGMSLSAQQVAALTSNVIIMQTETVNGEQVLVPVVYLAKASQQDMSGPLIAATDIDLQNTQTFTNSGTMQAGNTLSIQGQQIDNAFGKLQSGGLMSLATTGNVDLTSATVNAGSLALNAGGDLILNTAANTVDQVSATGATRTTTTLGPIANLNVKGDAAIVTGGNLEQNGGNLNVGGNLGMAVGGNYDLGPVQTGEHKVVAGANGVSNTNVNQTTGSSINVGGVSQIGVGGNLTATGADINLGGGGTVAVNGDVTLQAAKATSTVDSSSSGSDSHGSYSASQHASADTLTGTTLNAGDSLTIASGHDLNVIGSTISLDQGTATLAAANNINIGAATATYVDNSQEQHSHSNIVSGEEVASSSNTTATLSQGSLVSADAVTIVSGNDINVKGSTIVGTNDVALNAAHDVNITTSQDTMQSSSSYEKTRTGLGTSGLSVTVGTNKRATTDEASGVTNNASTIGSLNGDLSIQAGNTLHVTGSDLVAGGNLAGTAANVIIDAATDTSHQAQTQKTSSGGLTIGLAGSVGDAINNAYSESQVAKSSTSTGNDRAAALHSIAAAGDVALTGLTSAGVTADGKPDIGIKVSIGSSKSESQSSEDQTMQRGSSVQAGGTAGFVATNGDLTIAGSNISANDVILAAKNQVNVINTTDTDSTRSSNSSSSASVGVQYTLGGGFGVSATMSNAHGDANSDAAIQNASHVNGANSVTVISGGDTNIIGSQIIGRQIAADVGGNLNIVSVQDVTNSAAHQSSTGGGFTISQGGGSASFSAQNGHADSNYAGVNEQAGINAGDGGFNINVKGNTDLTGGVISSTVDASNNSLTTGTLTFSDIQNESHYSANSNGISAGVGFGGNTGKAVGPGSVSGAPGVSPMISQNESGDQSATTRSAISAGTINVTNGAGQTQDVANLSRDTTNTNGTVAETPDVNAILNQQADTMQAAQAAGQAVSQGIGAYADMKRDEAAAAYKAASDRGDSEGMAAAAVDYNNWKEGGDSRAGLHVAGGALIGGLGGGSALSTIGGAAGAGVASKMAGSLSDISKGVASATGSDLIGNLAANIAAGVGGAVVGGTAGAAMASNVQLYNQSMDDERALTGDSGKKSPSLFDLALQGIANGLNAIIGMGGGVPPMAGPGMVLADSIASNAVLGTPGYAPDIATLAKGDGAPPPNLSPDGAGRGGAFNEAKRNAGIPVSQQPVEVRPNVDRQGNVQPGYQYVYEVPAEGGRTKEVIIRDDVGGHFFGKNDPQNRGSHFNDPAGNHYDY
ncbi:filamentous hemagglutinin N-terminal domain-containing protein [Paraburkholderia sp. Ac-20336]|uniref:hemagglutinin repeat-containing protein n=1 Tax=Paraburkholderia sp. Ac-20336 TaxID=2703886 RepID=UPI00198217E1|nr:filamentous hemagglutinin N-terminal domain-containing protein [Paraburkholderia sp. Ac-20336]